MVAEGSASRHPWRHTKKKPTPKSRAAQFLLSPPLCEPTPCGEAVVAAPFFRSAARRFAARTIC